MTCRSHETGMYINSSAPQESTTAKNYAQAWDSLNNTRTSECCAAAGWYTEALISSVQAPEYCWFSVVLVFVTDWFTLCMTSKFSRLVRMNRKAAELWTVSRTTRHHVDRWLSATGQCWGPASWIIQDIHSHPQISQRMKWHAPWAETGQV